MTLKITTPSPKPEVLYLPAIFRLIRNGELRIPAFQRGFVWKPTQVLELLESVYQGFPIGSLLLWTIDVAEMQSDKSEDIPFPHPNVTGLVDFVLDGMQRISSLYGAFNIRADVNRERDPFAIVFDLNKEQFLPLRGINETCIDLSRLFSPRLLLEDQGRIAGLDGGDRLVDRSLELQRVFQEYLVPVVRISSASAAQVVKIFERVNNTGTKLSAVDFMRALTWSDKFDLTQELDGISDDVSELGFEIPNDTLAKIIALSMEIAPTGEEMVALREKSAKEMQRAVRATHQALRSTIPLFQRQLKLMNYEFVPYEGQFLVAASISSDGRQRSFPDWYLKWFWTVGFSESLQGRPDDRIARLALEARTTSPSGIPEKFTLARDALKSRGIRKGAALGMTFVAAIATGPCSSVFDGQVLEPAVMTLAFETGMLGAIFDRKALVEAVDSRVRTDKVIANVVLLAPHERKAQWRSGELRDAILLLGKTKSGAASLLSQCIDDHCLKALKKNDVAGFLEARAKLIFRRAEILSGVAEG